MVQPTQPWPLPEAIIVDIDGTISNYQHRKHLLTGKPDERTKRSQKEWDRFQNASAEDRPMKEIIRILRLFKQDNVKVILMTGRNERYRSMTELWLKAHGVPYDLLVMRMDGDPRSDADIKGWMYAEHCEHMQVLFVLDDRDSVVDMWRRSGLRCLQVRKGDY